MPKRREVVRDWVRRGREARRAWYLLSWVSFCFLGGWVEGGHTRRAFWRFGGGEGGGRGEMGVIGVRVRGEVEVEEDK